MNLDFSDDQKALGDQARRLLVERCTSAVVRRVMSEGLPYDRALWQTLGELGYLGAAIPEAYGGTGLGYLELCVIAAELGRVLAPVPLASSIYLAAEFLLRYGSETQKAHYLPRLAQGEAIGTFACAEAPGVVCAATIGAQVTAGRLHGRKVAVTDGNAADFAVVAARVGEAQGEVALYCVDLHDPAVSRAPLTTIDPSRDCATLSFAGAAAEPLGTRARGESDGMDQIARVLDRAAVLIAFEQVGGAEKTLEMARDYALQRTAFGRAIGTFQALKHMMADMYVAATLARSNAYYGAWALASNAPELPMAAAAARVSATQAFLHCAKNAIQVHGGVGFTWEFDCHLYYRRANQLAVVLGGCSEWEDLLIERLRQTEAA